MAGARLPGTRKPPTARAPFWTPERDGALVEFRERDRLTWTEIGRRLGVSTDAVKDRFSRLEVDEVSARPEETERECLGCQRVFKSIHHPRNHRICARCNGREPAGAW